MKETKFFLKEGHPNCIENNNHINNKEKYEAQQDNMHHTIYFSVPVVIAIVNDCKQEENDLE